MYKLSVTIQSQGYVMATSHFIEFESLAQVFLMVDMFEKHSKYQCIYNIEYVK